LDRRTLPPKRGTDWFPLPVIAETEHPGVLPGRIAKQGNNRQVPLRPVLVQQTGKRVVGKILETGQCLRKRDALVDHNQRS
jgi:hypothetical protein